MEGLAFKLVRIQCRVSKKRYLKSKRVYTYERMSLHIPKEHHETVKPFLRQDLDLSVKLEKGSLVVTLTPVKTFLPAEYAPQKSAPERLQTLEF